MSKFNVMPDNMTKLAENFNEYSKELRNIGNEVENIRDRLKFSWEIQKLVGQSLHSISQTALGESIGCMNLSNSLSNIAGTYKNTENQICGKAKIAWSGIAGAKGTSKIKPLDVPEWIYKITTSAMGPLGQLVDGVRWSANGEWGKVGSDIIKLAGGGVKNWSGSGINWKEWFGLTVSDKSPWERACGKYFNFSSVKKGFSSACNWAAQLVSSGYSNFKEFGNFGSRFWEETVGETLLKVGEGILVSAAVAAAFAGAPGIVIGGISAGVTVLVDWGLDSLVTWATGGTQTSWVEATSDFLCDAGEQIADWAKDTGKAIGDTVKNGFDNAVNAAQNFFGTVCKWGKIGFA